MHILMSEQVTCVTLYGLDPRSVMIGGTVSAGADSVAKAEVTLTTGTKI